MIEHAIVSRIGLCLITLMVLGADDSARGNRLLDHYLKAETSRLTDSSLASIRSREDWQQKRSELRRQFLEMLGLWPMPIRTDLRSQITGKVVTEWYAVEKVHFQSLPGLYVTGNLYLPLKVAKPAAAVLYLCGHSPVVINGVSYGNKVNYQHHGAWFAEHGYVCLVIDTLQLGECPGLHHGTHHLGMWWWQTRGYTPAGIECWNAIRALDYLETRKEVDPRRFGVTGRSGGGATTWWLAAADDRPQCIVPVAGIADLRAYIHDGGHGRWPKGVIDGHCDCMLFVNSYRWDLDKVMALCAPRPVLLGNSDQDDLFPVGGYRRPAARAKKVYELLGAGDRFTLCETTGGHDDTIELRQAAYRWMNRWLRQGETITDAEEERPRLTPQQLKVLSAVPDDAVNATIHATFKKPATLELPSSREAAGSWWQNKSAYLLENLRLKVFGGWPGKPSPLDVRAAEDLQANGLHLQAFDFMSEDEVPLRLWLLTAPGSDRPSSLVLSALDERGWEEWVNLLGPDFKGSLQVNFEPSWNRLSWEKINRQLRTTSQALAVVAPRGTGPTRWSNLAGDGKSREAAILRRFALLGQTLDSQRVWDIRRAVQALQTLPTTRGISLELQGKREMAALVLYAALFEKQVEKIDLWFLPTSHDLGPTFLNVRSYLDIPQALGLAFPRMIRLHGNNLARENAWKWPLRLQELLGIHRLELIEADSETIRSHAREKGKQNQTR